MNIRHKKIFKITWLLFLLVLFSLPAYAQTPYFNEIKDAKLISGCPKEAVVLVSWNGGNFGQSKAAETLAFMADLLRDADIVALQEVSTKEAGAKTVAKLADELNRTGAAWDYAISDATGGTGTERYAYLWKKSKTTLSAFSGSRVHLMKIYEDDMMRVPAHATFNFGNYRLEIMSFHLAPSTKKPEAEINRLEAGVGFDEAALILVGDFNLSPKKLSPVFEKKFGFKHQIDGLTSLRTKINKKAGYLSRAYDNVFTHSSVKVCQAGILDFVPAKKNLAEARKISDHLPVFIIFTPNMPGVKK